MCYSVSCDNRGQPERVCDVIERLECQASTVIIAQFPRTAVLLSNDIDSIPNVSFLILLLNFEYMGLQISDILCAQTGN